MQEDQNTEMPNLIVELNDLDNELFAMEDMLLADASSDPGVLLASMPTSQERTKSQGSKSNATESVATQTLSEGSHDFALNQHHSGEEITGNVISNPVSLEMPTIVVNHNPVASLIYSNPPHLSIKVKVPAFQPNVSKPATAQPIPEPEVVKPPEPVMVVQPIPVLTPKPITVTVKSEPIPMRVPDSVIVKPIPIPVPAPEPIITKPAIPMRVPDSVILKPITIPVPTPQPVIAEPVIVEPVIIKPIPEPAKPIPFRVIKPVPVVVKPLPSIEPKPIEPRPASESEPAAPEPIKTESIGSWWNPANLAQSLIDYYSDPIPVLDTATNLNPMESNGTWWNPANMVADFQQQASDSLFKLPEKTTLVEPSLAQTVGSYLDAAQAYHPAYMAQAVIASFFKELPITFEQLEVMQFKLNEDKTLLHTIQNQLASVQKQINETNKELEINLHQALKEYTAVQQQQIILQPLLDTFAPDSIWHNLLKGITNTWNAVNPAEVASSLMSSPPSSSFKDVAGIEKQLSTLEKNAKLATENAQKNANEITSQKVHMQVMSYTQTKEIIKLQQIGLAKRQAIFEQATVELNKQQALYDQQAFYNYSKTADYEKAITAFSKAEKDYQTALETFKDLEQVLEQAENLQKFYQSIQNTHEHFNQISQSIAKLETEDKKLINLQATEQGTLESIARDETDFTKLKQQYSDQTGQPVDSIQIEDVIELPNPPVNGAISALEHNYQHKLKESEQQCEKSSEFLKLRTIQLEHYQVEHQKAIVNLHNSVIDAEKLEPLETTGLSKFWAFNLLFTDGSKVWEYKKMTNLEDAKFNRDIAVKAIEAKTEELHRTQGSVDAQTKKQFETTLKTWDSLIEAYDVLEKAHKNLVQSEQYHYEAYEAYQATEHTKSQLINSELPHHPKIQIEDQAHHPQPEHF